MLIEARDFFAYKGPYVAYPSRPSLKMHPFCKVGRIDGGASVKHNISFSVAAPRARGLKLKHLKVVAFKGTQPDGSGGQAIGSDVEVPTANASETSIETKDNKSRALKAVWHWFWSLDLTIKMPLMIFGPMYLTVNLAYGTEISKELLPLWLLGPVIVALYIKTIRVLCALYVYAFQKTVKTFRYVADGEFKEDIRSRFWQPLVDAKNLDYKELSTRKMKQLQEWIKEKWIDHMEAMWPKYCRIIRYLKRVDLL